MTTNTNTIDSLSRATKVLLIINIAFFALAFIFPELKRSLALYYFESPLFKPHQLLTHFFMHSGFTHLLFNMYALVIFGNVVEKKMNTQPFLFLYFFSALGAFLLHMAVIWFQLSDIPDNIITQMQTEGAQLLSNGRNYVDEYLGEINLKLNTPSVGASGALMGVLAAFVYYFPNTKLNLIFIPIPIKAKYFVPIYMLIELFLGVSNFQWNNIAHFAHIGGAIFGWIAVLLVNQRNRGNHN
ncbi:MAG: rhomboid family intramembrane serine protease [Bacteroidota bacterium]